MDSTVRERFARMRENMARLEQDAERGRWDAATVSLILLAKETEFIGDWLRGQAEYHGDAAGAGVTDTWEPPSEPPLDNITEPLSGTLDADLPVPN